MGCHEPDAVSKGEVTEGPPHVLQHVRAHEVQQLSPPGTQARCVIVRHHVESIGSP